MTLDPAATRSGTLTVTLWDVAREERRRRRGEVGMHEKRKSIGLAAPPRLVFFSMLPPPPLI